MLCAKSKVEPGKAFLYDPEKNKTVSSQPENLSEGTTQDRWLTTGRVVTNNKGKPVKQYEPYFVDTPDYVSNPLLDTFGVTATLYYDPLLDFHHRIPPAIAMTYCFYLAPQVPDEARRLFDAAAANAGISSDGISELAGPRINAIAWFLSREWGIEEFEGALRNGLDASYEPTWDRASGEFTWGLGLNEEYPRGQFNSFLAAAEAVSPGAWARLTEAPLPKQPGLVEGIDFPKLALGEARWEQGVLRLRLSPRNEEAEGQPTQFRVTGLDDPGRWRVEGDARLTTDAGNLVVDTTIRDHRLAFFPAESAR